MNTLIPLLDRLTDSALEAVRNMTDYMFEDYVKLIEEMSESEIDDKKREMSWSEWEDYVEGINERVKKLGLLRFSSKVHYIIREKLNKVPESFEEVLESKEYWNLMKPEGSLYHMNGYSSTFRLKFVSNNSNQNFEVVFKPKDEVFRESDRVWRDYQDLISSYCFPSKYKAGSAERLREVEEAISKI
jgi:hypothetical protein